MFWKKFIRNLSKLGRAMLVPIVAMPAVGILGRLGASDMLNIPLMETASNAITGNLDMLFAFGGVLAFADSKDKSYALIGAAVGLFSFKACLAALDPNIGMGVFAGIIVGVLSAILYNHSRKWNTPEMFSFFTGEKFIIVLAPIFAKIARFYNHLINKDFRKANIFRDCQKDFLMKNSLENFCSECLSDLVKVPFSSHESAFFYLTSH